MSALGGRLGTRRKRQLAQVLGSVRRKTLWLLDMVPDEYLKVRVHGFYSPIGWHFGHVGRTEEFWVAFKALGRPVIDDRLSFLFADLPENPKDARVHLPSRQEIVTYLADTRQRTSEALDVADLDSADPFLSDGYAWEFAVQHECQHQETICEMLQLICKQQMCDGTLEARPLPAASPARMVEVAGGEFTMGSDDLHGYDNEKRAHQVRVESFQLDETPVTASAWVAFMQDQGYQRPELWSAEGWAWRQHESAEAPEYWKPSGSSYVMYGAKGLRPIHPDEPVSSVSWFEADAYARWAGKRLPTEEEWEFAGSAGTFPWGDEEPEDTRVVFGISSFKPAPVGGRPAGRTPAGAHDMAGNVWEWTSSRFLPYPGFVAFPYDGYSKEHMKGEHFVCRGGSWATAGALLRRSFRNWYVPGYRQGLLGARCAR